MSIGTGIFFAGFCLAIVALYAITRDRWAWKRIIGRAMLAVLGFAVLGGAGLFAYSEWTGRPRLIESLGGVSLADRRSDVTFKLGAGQLTRRLDIAKIDAYLASDDAKRNPEYAADALEARKKVVALAAQGEENFAKNASYEFGPVEVNFKNDAVHTIMHSCTSDRIDLTELNGVSCGTAGEVIHKKFGDAVRILCSSRKSPDSLEWRVFDVVSLGTRFYLQKNQVSGFMVARPETLRDFTKDSWVACR